MKRFSDSAINLLGILSGTDYLPVIDIYKSLYQGRNPKTQASIDAVQGRCNRMCQDPEGPTPLIESMELKRGRYAYRATPYGVWCLAMTIEGWVKEGEDWYWKKMNGVKLEEAPARAYFERRQIPLASADGEFAHKPMARGLETE